MAGALARRQAGYFRLDMRQDVLVHWQH